MQEIEKSLPAYLQVAQYFREKIETQELAPGAALPSVRQIADGWNIARATAERALKNLRDDGLVESRPGSGTFVASRRSPQVSVRWLTTYRKTGEIYPEGQKSLKVSVERIVASGLIAEALSIEAGQPVIRRHRVTYVDGGILSVSTSYLPGRFADAAPELLSPERLPEGTLGVIERHFGRQNGVVEERYTPRGASVDEAAELGVPEGAPVLAGRNWWYGQDDEVIEYGESVLPSGQWISYQMDLGSGDT